MTKIETSYFTKHNMLVSCRANLDAHFINLTSLLFKKLSETDFFKSDFIFISDIRELESHGTRQQNDRLLKWCDQIQDMRVQLYKDENWHSYTLFPSCIFKPKERSVYFKINQDLKETLLLVQKEFTILDFSSIVRLKTKYAKRLYEMISRYKYYTRKPSDSPHFRDHSAFLSKEDILLQLGLEDSSFSKNGALYLRKVINPAIKEINELSDIKVLDHTSELPRGPRNSITHHLFEVAEILNAEGVFVPIRDAKKPRLKQLSKVSKPNLGKEVYQFRKENNLLSYKLRGVSINLSEESIGLFSSLLIDTFEIWRKDAIKILKHKDTKRLAEVLNSLIIEKDVIRKEILKAQNKGAYAKKVILRMLKNENHK